MERGPQEFWPYQRVDIGETAGSGANEHVNAGHNIPPTGLKSKNHERPPLGAGISIETAFPYIPFSQFWLKFFIKKCAKILLFVGIGKIFSIKEMG